MASKQDTSKGKKSSTKRVLVIAGTTVAVATLTAAGVHGYRKRKAAKANSGAAASNTSQTTASSSPMVKSSYSSSTTSSRNDNFPLRKASKGNRVKLLQEALIRRYGLSVLPKYGADGDFGSETEAAVIKAGYPSVIEQSDYEKIIADKASLDAASLAKSFYNAIISRSYSSALLSLGAMNTTSDYKLVSESFQSYRINGVRKTLVNGLLDAFTSSLEKEAIRGEFLRMGLKYSGTTWSLSGVPTCSVQSKCPCKIQNVDRGAWFDVGEKLILGKLKSRSMGWIYFIPKGTEQTFKVKQSHVIVIEN